jgi:predicted amidophosphoribosyltransferase
MADPPVFARSRAVARFEDGPARTLAHRLKYSDRAELARPIAHWMARAGADLLTDADLLTPVPLHALRLWRRRFNQAAALAAEISRLTGKPCDLGALLRVKATRSQRGLPGALEGGREAGGRAGVRPGCDRRLSSHILGAARICAPRDCL